jgi:hypothetical protein
MRRGRQPEESRLKKGSEFMSRSLEEMRQSPFHQELGRKMFAAYIAQQQGIALDTAIKKVSDPIGDLWFLVAEFAREGCAGNADLKNLATTNRLDTGFVV